MSVLIPTTPELLLLIKNEQNKHPMIEYILDTNKHIRIKPLYLDYVLHYDWIQTFFEHTSGYIKNGTLYEINELLKKHFSSDNFLVVSNTYGLSSEVHFFDTNERRIYTLSSGKIKKLKKLYPNLRGSGFFIIFKNEEDKLLTQVTNLFGVVK